MARHSGVCWGVSTRTGKNGVSDSISKRFRATLICRKTKNLRAVQLLLGHSKRDYVVGPAIFRFPRD